MEIGLCSRVRGVGVRKKTSMVCAVPKSRPAQQQADSVLLFAFAFSRLILIHSGNEEAERWRNAATSTECGGWRQLSCCCGPLWFCKTLLQQCLDASLRSLFILLSPLVMLVCWGGCCHAGTDWEDARRRSREEDPALGEEWQSPASSLKRF